MTLNEIIQEVYNLTNRPDLVAETKSAVKAATIKAHASDFYSKDIFETGVQFDAATMRQSWDYPSTIPNFRNLNYIRIVADEYDTVGIELEVVAVSELYDAWGVQRSNIAYVAGRVLEIRAAAAFDKMLVGCYVTPVVTDAAYISWVAELQPYAIIHEACRVIFKTIGYDEQSAAYNQLVAEEYNMLRMLGLADVGY